MDEPLVLAGQVSAGRRAGSVRPGAGSRSAICGSRSSPPGPFESAFEPGQSPEAVKLLQAAVWMNPSFWQARYLLGVELARLGQAQEAEAQFAEVVRLRPDLSKAHLNLGVALAKRGKRAAPLAQFEPALRLNPTNEAARQNLEKLRAVISRGR